MIVDPPLRWFVTILVCFVLLSLSSTSHAEAPEPYRLAISSRAMGGGVDTADATAALKAWATAVEKEQNLSRKLEAELFTGSVSDIGDIFANGGYQGLGLTVDELLQLGITPKDVFVGNRGKSPFLDYVIVAANNSKFSEPLHVVGRKLVTSQSNQMLLAKPWYETLLHENGNHALDHFSFQYAENLSKAILKVFFGQAEGALVTRDAFDLACELNPQVCKNLRVLNESPPLIPVLFIFQPKPADAEGISELEHAILDLHKTPGGQQVLTVIQSYKMEKYPFSVLQSTIDMLEQALAH